MRQVPKYLLIGNGRLARHFRHYFSLLQLSFESWHRKEPLSKLHQQLNSSSHVLLLISDCAIEEFIATNLKDTSALRIHFSGSFISDHAYGVHPLMSFSENLYGLDQYQTIPFILDDDAPAFENLLPGLPNQHVRLRKSLKPKYHALCVLSGNFSCLLWQKFFYSLEHEFNVPYSIAYPYLFQQMRNLFDDPQSALTGPLVRDDMNTIKKNLAALHADPFRNVYESFVTCYKKITEET